MIPVNVSCPVAPGASSPTAQVTSGPTMGERGVLLLIRVRSVKAAGKVALMMLPLAGATPLLL